VRIFGDDLEVLRSKADEVRRAIAGVDGVDAPHVDVQANEPTVEIQVDLAAAERHRIKPGDVRRSAATLLSGITVGNLFMEQKVFDVVVWGTPPTRHSLTSIQNLLIDTPGGGRVRLAAVARARIRPNPTVIKHDAVSRYVDVVASIHGRPLGAVVSDVEQRLREFRFPLEYHAEVLGAHAEQRGVQQGVLSVAAATIGILLLLQACLGSWRLAALVFLTLPLALAGGALAAVLFGGGELTSFGSIAGLFPVLGIAARSGILLVKHYQQLEQDEGQEFGARLVLRGTRERLIPTALTALTVGLFLLPSVVLGGGFGLEVVRPLALVVLGGLLTSTLVSLLLVPVLYLRLQPHSQPDRSGSEPILSPAAG
jgi:Cu/Ag efflux pump CusA